MSHHDRIVRLYDTVFDRAPDAGGLDYWAGVMDQGHGLSAIAGGFIQAPEFAATYGQPDSLSFVREMYANVLDRPGEAGGVAYWTDLLDRGLAARPDIVVGFSESPEHVAQMAAAAAEGLSARFPPAAPEPQPGPPAGPVPLPVPPGPAHFTGSMQGETIKGHADRQNVIRGNEGDDTLTGGDREDTITGGPGRDWMAGGGGADIFRFEKAADMHGDGIADFRPGEDWLDFRPAQLEFRGLGPFEASGRAQLRYDETFTVRDGKPYSSQTDIYIDANGDGAADHHMMVAVASIGASSFLV